MGYYSSNGMTPEEIAAEAAEAERETAEAEAKRAEERQAELDAMNRSNRYKAKNRAKICFERAASRAGHAAMSWLSDEQEKEILAVYEEARQWCDQTGVKHDVDHIVPLSGMCPYTGVPNICGLHVPWNLRAIPSSMNRLRGNKYYSGGPAVDDSGDDIPF